MANGSSYSAYRILHLGYIALPMVTGIDKFFDALVNWPIYLAPSISKMVIPIMSIGTFMKIGGAAEIATGLLVAFKPKWGAFLLALWLGLIITNLLMVPGYYDIALRDFGLCLGALALGFLAKEHST